MADHESYTLLDTRGLVLHSYHQGKDPDALLDLNGNSYNTAAWGLRRFLETYPIFETFPPRRVIAVWDGGNAYRKKLYAGYKKKRHERAKEMPEAQAHQQKLLITHIEDLLFGLGATQMTVPGVEADDALAFLCDRLVHNQLIIHTTDQDLLQLSGTHQNVEVLLRNELIQDSHKDVPLNLITLYKSIAGDSSDEYPGMQGMGPAAFRDMLKTWGQDGMEQLDELVRTGNKRKFASICTIAQDPTLDKLLQQFSHWQDQYEIAQLYPGLCEGGHDTKLVEIEWRRGVPSHSEVLRVLRETGAEDKFVTFKPWLTEQRLADQSIEGGVALTHFRDHVHEGPITAFDYESYDCLKHPPFQEANKQNRGSYVDVLSQRITGVSFCYGDNYQHVIYMPCRHKEVEGEGRNYEPKYVAWAVNHAMSNSNLVAHNAVFEHTLTLNDLRLPVTKTLYDTQIMATYVNENETGSLKDYSRNYLGYHQATFVETLERYDASDMSELTPKQTLSYGCDDSIATAHLYDLFWLITRIEGTFDFLLENEFEFTPELVRGYLAGVNFDYARINELTRASEKAYADGMKALTEALTANAQDYSTERAAPLFLDLDEFQQAKVTAEMFAESKYPNWRQETWEKIYRSSRYVPYQKIAKEIHLKLTTKTLSTAALSLGLPKVEKQTKKWLSEEWIPHAHSAIEHTRDDAEKQAQQQALVQCIAAIISLRGAWKNKESAEYRALYDFCVKTLYPGGEHQTVGDELNFDSPPQMQQLLYAKLGLPIRVRSKVNRGSTRDKLDLQGAPSTDNKAVDTALAEDVAPDDWRYAALFGYRQAKTALTSQKLFLRPLPLWQHPADQMVHPQIKNCGTATHRPTGSSPNMLQLTKKDGGELRSTVRPRLDGHVIITADWNGQELRILASESEDPALLDAYIGEDKKDVHSVTAAAIAPIFFGLREFTNNYSIDDFASLHSVSYEQFIKYLHHEDESTRAAMGAIRKAAKQCIAEGSPVLTDRGLVPIEQVQISDKVWDGIEWVAHEGVIYKGMREVITYDGVTATPDHIVCTQDGRNIPIGDCARESTQPRLAVGEVNGVPVGHASPNPPGILERQLSTSKGALQRLWKRVIGLGRQLSNWKIDPLPMCAYSAPGPEIKSSLGTVYGLSAALHQPQIAGIQKLRGARNRSAIQVKAALYKLCLRKVPTEVIPGITDRPDRQQCALRTWQHSNGVDDSKHLQQTNESARGISWSKSEPSPSLAFAENGLSTIQSCFEHRVQTAKPRYGAGGDSPLQAEVPRRAKVYDIVNAGPRHRFTVSGRVVHNCNFLIIFGGGPTTLARNLLIKQELAKKIMDQVFERYARLRPWQQETIEFARRHGYTQTAYGNRRHLGPDLFSNDDDLRSRLERQGTNFILQGCAADILKVTMAEAQRRKFFTKTSSFLVAPVYDELACSVPRAAALDFCLELQEIMNITPPGHKVPMVAEFALSADSWGRVSEIGSEITESKLNEALAENHKEQAA